MSGIRVTDCQVPVPSAPGDESAGTTIAATVHLPWADALPERPAVLVVLPGAGYGRGYFDLPDAEHSQARHHAGRGVVVIAIDHLGVGESTVPPAEATTMAAVAAADHAAVTAVLELLRTGDLRPDIPPLEPGAVVGAGQSMGGHVVTAMQAVHRTFDGIALLGSSIAGTRLPARPGAPALDVPEGISPEESAARVAMAADWRWIFHWEDEGSHPLAEADAGAGLPMRAKPAAWASLTVPGMVYSLMLPGAVAAEAARVDVPVLLARGERDVCRAPLEEAAAFTSATDLAVLTVPRMAHMHNFAPTRHVLWRRLDAFVQQIRESRVREIQETRQHV